MRPRRVGLLVLIGLLAGWAVSAAVLFAWPRQTAPTHADVVIVLSGRKASRLRRGLALVERGVAPVLVVSDGWDPAWPEANRLCAGRASFRVVCFRPRPYSTRGEARGFARLAAARGWRSVVVVSSTYHVSRARMLFERCFDGDVYAVGARYPAREGPYAFVNETAKLGYALALARDC